MLTLCGFPASNYYNKVKLALLEKGVAFEEEPVFPSRDEALLAFSPMGKVPYLRTASRRAVRIAGHRRVPRRGLSGHAAVSGRSDGRAKCRELIHVIELYLELPARRLYPQAFFGGTVSEETRKQVAPALVRGARAVARADAVRAVRRGDQFTYADCTALVHLPTVSEASKSVLGEDLLADAGPLRDYQARLGQRPHVMR